MIRVLRSARHSAVKARSQATNQLKALLVTAPEDLRHRLRTIPTKELLATCARFRLGGDPENVRTATRFALRSFAAVIETLSEEIAELDAQMDRLVAEVAPGLISRPAIGTHHAATLLVLAGDNPERLNAEASFASLCGVSPIEASSGKVGEAFADRWSNRDANRALHVIAGCAWAATGAPGTTSHDAPQGQEQAGDHALPEALVARECPRQGRSACPGWSP